VLVQLRACDEAADCARITDALYSMADWWSSVRLPAARGA